MLGAGTAVGLYSAACCAATAWRVGVALSASLDALNMEGMSQADYADLLQRLSSQIPNATVEGSVDALFSQHSGNHTTGDVSEVGTAAETLGSGAAPGRTVSNFHAALGSLQGGAPLDNVDPERLVWEGMVLHLMGSKMTVLLVLNCALSLFALLALMTKVTFFGRLTSMESRKTMERLMNYVVFKIVFVGAVVEPDVLEIFLWTVWFAALGFLKIFAGLVRDRCNWLTSAPAATTAAHVRNTTLLMLLLLSITGWGLACCYVYQHAGLSEKLLLMFEVVLIKMDLVQTLIRYALHLSELWCLDPTHQMGEWRGTLLYHTDFVADTLTLALTLLHFTHIWWLHGVAFQLIDAILFLNIKTFAASLRHRVQSYVYYCAATRNLREAFPDATREQLDQFDDECAICKESMSTAKRLPCGHLFHLSCLRSWLEQGVADNYTCPTCRFSLLLPKTEPAAGAGTAIRDDRAPPPPQEDWNQADHNPPPRSRSATYSVDAPIVSDPLYEFPRNTSSPRSTQSSALDSPARSASATHQQPIAHRLEDDSAFPRESDPASGQAPGRLASPSHLEQLLGESLPREGRAGQQNSRGEVDSARINGDPNVAVLPGQTVRRRRGFFVMPNPLGDVPNPPAPYYLRSERMQQQQQHQQHQPHQQPQSPLHRSTTARDTPPAGDAAARSSSGSGMNGASRLSSGAAGGSSSANFARAEAFSDPGQAYDGAGAAADATDHAQPSLQQPTAPPQPRFSLNWLPRMLPTFSLTNLLHAVLSGGQDMNAMADQVADILPNAPRDIILRHLQRTWSVEHAVNNLLEEMHSTT